MKNWKRLEKKIEQMRGTSRTPPSGRNSRITRSDTLDETFFIECKYRSKSSVWSLYNELEALAKKEGKVPVLVVKEKGKHGELFVVKDDYLEEFIENWGNEGDHYDKSKKRKGS